MTVTIFSRVTCGPCKQLKAYLQSKQVQYTEIDLDANPEREKDVVALTGLLQVPTTLIVDETGPHPVSGYNLPRIAALLNK